MFMGGGRISVFGKTVRPAAESGCSASPAGSEKISKQRARAYRKKQAVWQKAQAEREAALREARIERDKAMRERQMALREARIEREAAMREACAERRKDLDVALRKQRKVLQKTAAEQKRALRKAERVRQTGMGALGNDRSEAADDFSSTEILVGCPRGPVAVGYAGSRIRPYTLRFRCSAVSSSGFPCAPAFRFTGRKCRGSE